MSSWITVPALSWQFRPTITRDFDFAKKYGLEIIPVVDPQDPAVDLNDLQEACPGEGTLINSGEFDGLNNKEAIEEDHRLIWKKKE